MSRLIARILLTVFMLPLAAMVYLGVFVILERSQWINSTGYYPGRESKLFLISGAITWVPIAIYWIAVWNGVLKWNANRRVMTLLVAIVAGLLASFVYVIFYSISEEAAGFLASALAPMLWIIATIFVWRETTAERAARLNGAAEDALICPNCGYNLTGLSEPRCPECGSKFTLSELLAAQPKRQLAKMDHEVSG